MTFFNEAQLGLVFLGMLSHLRTTLLPFVGPVLLAISFGFAVGRTVDIYTIQAHQSIRLQTSAQHSNVPTVVIEGIRNGNVEGIVRGDVRFFIGTEQVLPQTNQHFSVDAKQLLTNIITVKVPTGMQYVASKNGSKYYPVQSAGGNRISVKNRVYFRTATEAEEAGFKK